MRLIAIAILFFGVSVQAETKGTIRPEVLAKAFARTCSTEGFQKWGELAKHEGFFEKAIPVVEMKIEGKSVVAKEHDLTMTKTAEGYSALAGGKTYASKDLCDLLVSLTQQPATSASIFNFIVPTANARNSFVANRLKSGSLVAGGLLMAGGCGFLTVKSAGLLALAGSMTCTGAGITAVIEGSSEWKELTALENVLNSEDLEITCNSVGNSITGAKHKIECTKRSGPKLECTVQKGNSVVLRSQDIQKHSNLGRWIHELGFSCNNSEVGRQVVTDIKNWRIRDDLATALQNGPAILGVAPKSVLPEKTK